MTNNCLGGTRKKCKHPRVPRVFMYGPDARQGRMFDRVGPSEFVGTARVDGYELVFNKPNMKAKDEGLANMAERAGASVVGLVFNVSYSQLERLAGYFGGYETRTVSATVIVHQENEADAPPTELKEEVHSFIARRTKSNLKPSKATLSLTVQALRDCGVDDDTLKTVSSLETTDV